MKLMCVCGHVFTVKLNDDGYSIKINCIKCKRTTELNRRCNNTWFTIGSAIPL